MNRSYFQGLKVVAQQKALGLFLDIFTDAAIAFSLTTLRTGVTNVIRVVRSSDNDERDFSAIEIIDGTLVSWVGVGNDGLVKVIYDQSLNGNHARQTDTARMARIVVNGNLQMINGRPAIDFNSGNWYATDNPYPTGTAGTHLYTATAGSSNQRILDTRGTGGKGAVKGWQHKTLNAGDVSLFDQGQGSGTFLETSSIIRSGQFIASINFEEGFVEEFTNDGATPSDTDTAPDAIDFNSGNPLYIGANVNGQTTQLYTGELQEVILFNTDRSAQRVDMLQNRNEYFNIF